MRALKNDPYIFHLFCFYEHLPRTLYSIRTDGLLHTVRGELRANAFCRIAAAALSFACEWSGIGGCSGLGKLHGLFVNSMSCAPGIPSARLKVLRASRHGASPVREMVWHRGCFVESDLPCTDRILTYSVHPLIRSTP